MGSSSSRIGPQSSRKPIGTSKSRLSRTKRKLSSLFCGASFSHSALELEYHPCSFPASSVENQALVSDGSTNSITESSVILFDSEPEDTSYSFETGASSGSSGGMTKDALTECNLINVEANNRNTCLPKDETTLHQQSAELVATNARGRMVSAADAHVSTKADVSLNCLQNENASSGSHERTNPFLDDRDAVIEANTFSSGSFSVSDSVVRLPIYDDDVPQYPTTSAPDHLFSENEQGQRNEDMSHLDLVSISSNLLSSSNAEVGYREARRNTRRIFWDALSRCSFRRRRDSPTILFATGHADELGSHDRWLLDFSGDLEYDGVGNDSSYLGTGNRYSNERRWPLQSEIPQRFLSGLDERDHDTTFCASGLHPDGTCSCESFFIDEDFTTLARISRIIMVAEALFEVLDEIYGQPSLSMLSPAPETVVDSFPIKYHKKLGGSQQTDVQQCYICLAEYEDGDELRILPCHHEYHTSCVDKWLKEVNRVCPVCRGNVCESAGGQDSVTDTGIPSR